MLKVHLLRTPDSGGEPFRATGLPGVAAIGEIGPTPPVARKRLIALESQLEQERKNGGTPMTLTRRYFLPMLESALALGDLATSRRIRDSTIRIGDPNADLPKWHQLNVALNLAAQDAEGAREHAWKLLALMDDCKDDEAWQASNRTLTHVAYLLRNMGSSEEAARLLAHLIREEEARFGPNDPSVAFDLVAMAGIQEDRGELDEAESACRRAYTIFQKHSGEETIQIAHVLRRLASIASEKKQLSQAEAHLQKAIRITEKERGKEDRSLSHSYNLLGTILYQAGRPAEAIEALHNSLSHAETLHGMKHPELIAILGNLGLVSQYAGEPNEAQRYLGRAGEIAVEMLGPEHPLTVRVLNRLRALSEHRERGEIFDTR